MTDNVCDCRQHIGGECCCVSLRERISDREKLAEAVCRGMEAYMNDMYDETSESQFVADAVRAYLLEDK